MKAAAKGRQIAGNLRGSFSPSTAKSRTASRDPEMLRMMDLWKEEIHDLSTRKFSSLEEGIEALAEKVLLRFKMHGNKEMREHLIAMLSEDPLIVSDIRQALQI